MPTINVISRGVVPPGTNTIPLHPTLFIGLGGSGMKILREVRRNFMLAYGSPGLPCVRYLWMDTDINEIHDGGEVHELPGVKFDPALEVISLTLDELQFNKIVENPNKYHHIHSWMDSDLRSQGNLSHGASQNRQAGRLGFFCQVGEISARIEQCVNGLVIEATQSKMRAPVEEGGAGFPNYESTHLDIVLVHSLAGGTGAGCFLDLAFLLRNKIRTSAHWAAGAQINVISYALLPSVYFLPGSDSSKPYANTMAVLRELEHYSKRVGPVEFGGGAVADTSRRFQASWPGQVVPEEGISGPPFDLMYLVDHQTESSNPLAIEQNGQAEVFNMVAQRLFMPFTKAGFATRLRSTASNIRYRLNDDESRTHDQPDPRDPTSRVPVHTEIFRKHFCGLGLSRFYLPSAEIRRACSTQMGIKLLDHWLRDRPLANDSAQFAQGLLKELGVDFRTLLDRFLNSGGQHWRDHVSSTTSQARQDLVRSLRGKDRKLLDKRVNVHFGKLRDEFKWQRDQAPQEWGEVANQIIYQGQTREREATQAALEQKIRTWSDAVQFGPLWTVLALTRIAQTLDPEVADLEGRLKKTREAAEASRKDLRRLVDFLREEQEIFPRQAGGLRALVTVIAEVMELYYTRLLEAMALEQMIEFHGWLKGYLGMRKFTDTTTQKEVDGSGLIQSCVALIDQLGKVRTRLQQNLAVYDREEDRLTEFRLYRKGDFMKYFVLRKEGGSEVKIGPEHLSQLELEVFTALGAVTAVQDLRQHFERFGERNLLTALDEKGSAWFKPDRNKLRLDLIEHISRLTPAQIEDIKARLIAWGRPWTQEGAERRAYCSRQILIGVHPSHMANATLSDIVNDVCTHLGPGSVTMLDGEVDCLWVASELYGLPAASVFNLEYYSNQYKNMLVDSMRHHTRHTQPFKDVISMSDPEMFEHLKAVELLLRSLVLQVVTVAQPDLVGGTLTFSYEDRQVIPPHLISLSKWEAAVSQVRHIEKIRSYLSQQVALKSSTLDGPRISAIALSLYKTVQTKKLLGRRFVSAIVNGTPVETEIVTAEATVMKRLLDEFSVRLPLEPGQDVNHRLAELYAKEEHMLEAFEDNEILVYLPR